MVNTASELYYKLLNICTNQYNKLSEDQKKTINVLNRPENLLKMIYHNATTRR